MRMYSIIANNINKLVMATVTVQASKDNPCYDDILSVALTNTLAKAHNLPEHNKTVATLRERVDFQQRFKAISSDMLCIWNITSLPKEEVKRFYKPNTTCRIREVDTNPTRLLPYNRNKYHEATLLYYQDNYAILLEDGSTYEITEKDLLRKFTINVDNS